MKLVNRSTVIFDRVLDLLAIIACGLILFAMFSVGTDVVMRYLLNRPMIWVFDVTETILLWITFLGAAWLLRREGHVRMDIVLTLLKPKTRALFNFITSIFILIICCVLCWYGTQVTWDQFQRSIVIPRGVEIPSAATLVIIPIGFFFLSIVSLRMSYGYLRRWRERSITAHREGNRSWNGG